MKKNGFQKDRWWSVLIKTLMIMKLSIFILCLTVFSVAASETYSQNTKLSLSMRNVTIKDVLRSIEDKSEFRFFYTEKLSVENKVSIDCKNKVIGEVLDGIFKGTDIAYRVVGRQIALYRNSNEPSVFPVEQPKTISGRVTDSSGAPLPGVTVVIKGTTQGTITDTNGNYSISNIPANATLQFSFVGMKSQEIPVSGKTTVIVAMAEDAIGLDEVVAVGYGTMKKRDLTGSVGSVSASDLREAPITMLEEGLQGRIPGVRIQNTDGLPGGGSKVRIRGTSSINFSNDPLYVIDGFIGADIATINPKDIESIDILKDASATAIYGSRGANGVVLITTHAPKAGDIKIKVDASYGVVNIPKFFPMSDFGNSLNWVNDYNIATGGTTVLTQNDIETLLNQGETDWQREITQSGSKSDINVGLTGGSEKMQYYMSANYYDEVGTILSSGYKRYSLRSNITSQISKRIKMVFNSFGTNEDRAGVGRSAGGTVAKAFNYPRIWPAYDANGDPSNPDLLNSYGIFNIYGRANPLDQVSVNGINITNTVQSNLDLTFDITDYLTFTISNSGKYGVNYNASQSNIAPPETNRNDVSVTQYNSHLGTLMNYDVLTFSKKFGEHSIQANAIYEYSKSTFRKNGITVSGLSTLGTGYNVLEVGSPSRTESGLVETKWRSYMGRINYAFKDKYLVTASIRADGSSKFRKENRWGYFPSAAFAWRLSEEGFIKDNNVISNLKLRIGYGEVGNASLPAYSTRQLLTATNASYDYNDATLATVETGVLPGSMVDPNLKWEISKQFNAGIDWSLFNGRLSGVVDYYNKTIENLILEMRIPSINGVSTYRKNIGSIGNSGFELSLDGILVDKTDFSLKANFNISFNQSEVLDLGDVDRIWIGSSSSSFVVNVGEPIGQIWGYKNLGTWKLGEEAEAARYKAEPGILRYEDLDNNGSYGIADKQVIANTTPTTNIGFGLNFRYKNLDMAISGYGVFDFDVYNSNAFYFNAWDDPKNANRWTPEKQTDIPKFSPVWSPGMESRKVEKGDFIKVGNFTLGYTFNKNIFNRFGLSDTRIYLSGNNLFTFTGYSGLDPEATISPLDSDAVSGVDEWGYPSTRTFSFGINLNF